MRQEILLQQATQRKALLLPEASREEAAEQKIFLIFRQALQVILREPGPATIFHGQPQMPEQIRQLMARPSP